MQFFLYSLTLFMLVQSTTPLVLKTDLAPFVRHTRQARDGCTLPPYPVNGRYSTSGADVYPGRVATPYTIINFECDVGYRVSKSMAYCQEKTYTWSEQGKCESIDDGCVVPNQPAHGWHSLITGEKLVPGSRVEPFTLLHYACNAGYNVTARMSVCQDGGEWSATPVCRSTAVGGCVLPKMPDNGAYTIQNNDCAFSPGSTVQDFTILEVTCNKGYMATKTISVCSQAEWTPIPVCAKLCGKLKSETVNLFCEPVVEDGCPIGSIISPSCKAGHRKDGPLETMTCVGGRWDKRQPTCKIMTCDLITSSTVNLACYDSNDLETPCQNKAVDGETIYFSCKEGYTRDEGNFGGMRCSGGQWNTPLPNCAPISPTSTEQPVTTGSKCTLPSYPPNGKWKVLGLVKNLKPGVIVDESTYINYSCDTNYDASTEQVFSTCEAGKWDLPPPECRQRCPMVQSLSVDFRCSKSGVEMDCPELLPYGSVVTSTCKSGHHSPSQDLDVLTCSPSGYWDNPLPDCKPDCGLEKPFGGVQILGGVTFKKDTFPWHVGIFQWNVLDNTIGQVCGGSIIHVNLVISAAHCFFDETNKTKIDAKYYKVAAGKFLRSWDNDLAENANLIQKSDVSNIYLPLTYGGDEQSQQHDLALLQLATPFKLAHSVRAVCYDLSYEQFDTFQTLPGKIGKVAGWGFTETGLPSEKLKTLDLPVISYGECRTEMFKYRFGKYLTTDKLCAGHLDGRAMCKGDSGGGLVFPSVDKENFTRWYLRGVVSNGPLSDDQTTCRANTYTAFTNVFKMRDWLKKAIRDVTRPITNNRVNK